MDGTFNQTAPLKRLLGEHVCYSNDLTAATDRWPMLFEIMQFDRSLASSAVNSALATNTFVVPFVKSKFSIVSFIAGQPLGYYASWPLFTLSHHMVIW